MVEHDLSVLDYLSDFICCLYGVPGAYGVVTMPFSVREGCIKIKSSVRNHFLTLLHSLSNSNLSFYHKVLIFSLMDLYPLKIFVSERNLLYSVLLNLQLKRR